MIFARAFVLPLSFSLLSCSSIPSDLLLREPDGFAPAQKQLACPRLGEPQITGSVIDARLPEISSVLVSRKHPGLLWVLNDSGNPAELFGINQRGQVLAYYKVVGEEAFDWEGLAYGGANLLIADTGDNHHVRGEGVVLEIEEPDVISLDGRLSVKKKHALRYPQGKENVEAFAADPVDGSWVFATRGDGTGNVATIYQRTADTVRALRSFAFGDGHSRGANLTTSADIDLTGSRLILRTYTAGYLWQRAPSESWADALARAPCPLALTKDKQGEAIAFDSTGFYTLSEGLGEPIRHYTLK